MVFQLPSGRQIGLRRLSIEGTYAGLLEGTPESASRFLLRGAAERAAGILPPGKPLTLLRPPMPLPQWMVVAEFESRSGAHTDDPDFRSFLYACWFCDDVEMPLREWIESILPQIDWEALAQDYDFTMM